MIQTNDIRERWDGGLIPNEQEMGELFARIKELEERLAHAGKLAGAVAEHPGMTKSRLKLIREVCARK